MSGPLFVLRFEAGPFDGFDGVAEQAPPRLYVKSVEGGEMVANSRGGGVPYVEVAREGSTVRYVFEDVFPVAGWCGAVELSGHGASPARTVGL